MLFVFSGLSLLLLKTAAVMPFQLVNPVELFRIINTHYLQTILTVLTCPTLAASNSEKVLSGF